MGEKIGKIYQYWENNARKHGTSHVVSWGDINMINLEIETISKYIKKGDRLLDAGCANGYSTLRYISRKPELIRAFDYSPSMINAAIKNLNSVRTRIPVNFYRADIRDIQEPDNYFDISITTRVLINLPGWKLQKKAVDEMIRVTKRGGLILFSEAFIGGLRKINKLRSMFSLPPLSSPVFNKYIDEDLFFGYIRNKGLKCEVINFSSLYYIGSRVIREAYIDKGEKASYKHFINDFFLSLERKKDKQDFGIQKLFVVKK